MQLDEKLAIRSTAARDICLALGGSRFRRIADARIGGDLRPATRRPRPSFAHTGQRDGARVARARFLNGRTRSGTRCIIARGLRFARVIARFLDELLHVDARPPIDRRERRRASSAAARG